MSILQPIQSPETRGVIRERDEALRERDGVTVCVPCYRQAEYLPDCIESLIAQTVPPLEIIVIDDGTPDDSVLQAILDHGWFCQYIRVTNRGLPNARNTGLMLAKGRAFLPLDADDAIAPTFIEKTLPLLDEAHVVLTGIQERGVRNGTYMPGFDMDWQDVREDHLWAMNRFYYASLYRTSLLRGVGGWNGRMTEGYEDWDLTIDLFRRGARYAAVLEPLFLYTTRHGSMLSQAEAQRDQIIAEMRRHHLG